jgi:hypothetical protein
MAPMTWFMTIPPERDAELPTRGGELQLPKIH